MLLKLFCKVEREGMQLNYSTMPVLSSIPDPDKDTITREIIE
jgi:hypothetical protein